MIDLRLRFPDEASAIAALPALRGTDENGSGVWLTASHTHALDIIGPVGADSRWHANLRLLPGADPAIATAAEPFAVVPADPVRVWA
jgi:hypothetical protein